jgi:hypothetical protein
VTLAYAALTLALPAGALLSRVLVGRPRTPRAERDIEDQLNPEELFRPAEVDDEAWCPAEETWRLHAFTGRGTRVCWTCRTETPTAVPRG